MIGNYNNLRKTDVFRENSRQRPPAGRVGAVGGRRPRRPAEGTRPLPAKPLEGELHSCALFLQFCKISSAILTEYRHNVKVVTKPLSVPERRFPCGLIRFYGWLPSWRSSWSRPPQRRLSRSGLRWALPRPCWSAFLMSALAGRCLFLPLYRPLHSA